MNEEISPTQHELEEFTNTEEFREALEKFAKKRREQGLDPKFDYI